MPPDRSAACTRRCSQPQAPTRSLLLSTSASAILIGVCLTGAIGCSDTVGPNAVAVAVSVTPESPVLGFLGDTVRLTATARDAKGNTITGKTFTWQSSVDTIASVSASGLVTAAAPGTATIAAEADGVVGEALVTVAQQVARITMDPLAVSFTRVGQTQHFSATAVDSGGVVCPESQALTGVWGTSSTDVYSVGDDGVILHYDGTVWSAMTSETRAFVDAVWGTSSSDVYAVGGGTILHSDGTAWSTVVSRDESLTGIWGTSSIDIYAVGTSGTILRGDGTAWSVMTSGTRNFLIAVWGTSSTDVYVVGDHGIILRWAR